MLGAEGVGKLVCDPDDPESCVQPVKATVPAPFTGLLLSKRRAAIVTGKAQKCDESIVLARSEEQELGAHALKLEQDLRRSDKAVSDVQLAALREGMVVYKERFAPKASDHPLLWFMIGVGTASLLVAGAVAVLDNTRPTVVTVP